MWFFFFFQAEDGIRDDLVTGVQTCALPISSLTPEDGFVAALSLNEPMSPGCGLPAVENAKSSSNSAGTVALTISTLARLVFVNVHTTVSPASTSRVALRSPRFVDESPPPPVHSRAVRSQPSSAVSVTVCGPCSEASRSNDAWNGVPALAGSVSRSRFAGTPDPVRSKSKSCGSDAGSVTLTTFSEACFVLVNVQTTVSPASMSSVAERLARLVDESTPAPGQSSAVRSQPAVSDSVTLCPPSCDASSWNDCCDGVPALAGSVSRSTSAGSPDPVRSKSKSCGSDAGSVTLTTVSDACLVFVNVLTTVSPASMSNVALRSPRSVDESPPPPVHSSAVRSQPGVTDSVTAYAPSWPGATGKVSCEGVPALPGSVSRSTSAGTAAPVRSKSKSCGSEAGSVTLTTVSDAPFVFVNVQTTLSPASISSVAVRVPRLVEESPPPPVHSRAVSAQPGVTDSVTECAPSCDAFRLNDCCEGSVASPPSVSRSRSAVTPEPVRSKSKSCGSEAGSVTLTTVSDACLVFVNVQTTVSPASMSSVAVRSPRSVDESPPAPVHASAVRSQPGVTDSATVWPPSCDAFRLNVV